MKSLQEAEKAQHIFFRKAGRYALQVLSFVALYAVFASLLNTFAAFPGSHISNLAEQDRWVLFGMHVMPLIFAFWGYRTGLALTRQAMKIMALVPAQHDPRAASSKTADSDAHAAPQSDHFNLHEFIYQCMNHVTRQSRKKALVFCVNVHANVPEIVAGPRSSLQQILRGLLDNACRYTEKGEIILSVKTLEQSHGDVLLRFEITDTGAGIPLETQSHLFECSSDGCGSLAAMRPLVETLGGKIGVTSREHNGSAFWFIAILRKQANTELAA